MKTWHTTPTGRNGMIRDRGESRVFSSSISPETDKIESLTMRMEDETGNEFFVELDARELRRVKEWLDRNEAELEEVNE